jgi:hypothetical protein
MNNGMFDLIVHNHVIIHDINDYKCYYLCSHKTHVLAFGVMVKAYFVYVCVCSFPNLEKGVVATYFCCDSKIRMAITHCFFML